MERPRLLRLHLFRVLAAAATVAVGSVAAAPALTPARAFAGDASSPPSTSGCGLDSCTYSRTGQSVFRVPLGVTLLQVDVIGAGASGRSKPPTVVQPWTPRKGEAVEVEGNVALSPHMSALEVVVGGKDTLGGTTSEIMTLSDSTSQVLVAADGVPVTTSAKGGKSTGHPKPSDTKTPETKTPETTTRDARTTDAKSAPADEKADKKAAQHSSTTNRMVATPTRVPVGGTVTPASGPARVVIRWRAPGQPPRMVSSWLPVLDAGTPTTFVVQEVAATVPRLTESGSLPLGLRFRDQGNGTAAIEGVPEVDGVYPLEVTATAGTDPPVTQNLVLVIRGGLIHLGALSEPGSAQEPIAVTADA